MFVCFKAVPRAVNFIDVLHVLNISEFLLIDEKIYINNNKKKVYSTDGNFAAC